jgi:hypothetical protein
MKSKEEILQACESHLARYGMETHKKAAETLQAVGDVNADGGLIAATRASRLWMAWPRDGGGHRFSKVRS